MKQEKRMLKVPTVRWTRYGRWTDDGLYVMGQHGRVVYTHPEANKRRPDGLELFFAKGL